MTILVSNHFVYAGRVGGAEHMAYNLVRGLNQAGADPVVLCTNRSNLWDQFVQECEHSAVPVIECGGNRGPRFVIEQLACLDSSLHGDAILFPNYFLPPFIPARLGAPAVVIHDFLYRHSPQYFSARKRAWLRVSHARAMRYAHEVIFISEFVRQDAIRWFGSIARRGIVIPNPISWDRFSESYGSPSPEDRPYILSVAAHYAHKQLDVLLKAFADFSRKRPDYCLVLVGQLAGNLVSNSNSPSALGRLIAELQLTDRVRVTGYLTDAEVGNYYRYAAAFAFPSVFEGFGMPVVEALGFGLPCLTTRCTAIPEVTLGLATYVDNPADVGEWASRLQELVDAPRLSSIQIQRVRDRYAPLTIGHQYKSALSGNRMARRIGMPALPSAPYSADQPTARADQ